MRCYPVKHFAYSLFLGILTHGSLVAGIKSELVASGFINPAFVTAPKGDTNRLFVVEHTVDFRRHGRVLIVDLQTHSVLEPPFLEITNLHLYSEGLLGFAFHPGYITNGYVYVHLIGEGGGESGHNEIARFQVQGDPATSNVVDPASKKILLTADQPKFDHNGGWIGFGLDGYLYIAIGDGGSPWDQFGTIGNAQDRTSLLGKLLRIDVDGGDPYRIPEDNPYKGHASFREEIWAFGLRNPWRCSVDRETGDIWIGDVGQASREEINFIPAEVGGLNFGWRPVRGTSKALRTLLKRLSPALLSQFLPTVVNPVHVS